MAATTAALPEPALELNDDAPDTDCRTCGLPHDAEIHHAVLSVRRWLKAGVARRLELAPVIKFKRRAGRTTPIVVGRGNHSI